MTARALANESSELVGRLVDRETQGNQALSVFGVEVAKLNRRVPAERLERVRKASSSSENPNETRSAEAFVNFVEHRKTRFVEAVCDIYRDAVWSVFGKANHHPGEAASQRIARSRGGSPEAGDHCAHFVVLQTERAKARDDGLDAIGKFAVVDAAERAQHRRDAA